MAEAAAAHAPSRLAFGSCNEQDMQNKLWPIIQERNPTAFIWGGDAIYAGM
jgi:alkaline phosphatase D